MLRQDRRFRGPGLAGDLIPCPQLEFPDLGHREIYVFFTGKVVARSQKAVAVGMHFKDAHGALAFTFVKEIVKGVVIGNILDPALA